MTRGYRWLLIGPESPLRQQETQTAAPAVMPRVESDEFHLFARGDESIRITIHAGRRALTIVGPGRTQKLHTFTNNTDLDPFLQAYEQSLVDSGWKRLEVADRRNASRSR